MTKLVYRLGGMLLVWGTAAIFGNRFMLWASCITIVLFAGIALAILYDRYRMARFRRKVCDDAIFYAQKKRQAFGDADYTSGELNEMRVSRDKGDFERVHTLISASNLRMLEQKQANSRQSVAEKRAVRRRDAEVRLYRA